jgi:hypothetical protein
MTHYKGQQDHDLHNEDGSHRSTPPSALGRVLEAYEPRIRRHLAKHAETTEWFMITWQADDGQGMFHALRGTYAEAEAWATSTLAVPYRMITSDTEVVAAFGRRKYEED